MKTWPIVLLLLIIVSLFAGFYHSFDFWSFMVGQWTSIVLCYFTFKEEDHDT